MLHVKIGRMRSGAGTRHAKWCSSATSLLKINIAVTLAYTVFLLLC
jgi:hypothetical protein